MKKNCCEAKSDQDVIVSTDFVEEQLRNDFWREASGPFMKRHRFTEAKVVDWRVP